MKTKIIVAALSFIIITVVVYIFWDFLKKHPEVYLSGIGVFGIGVISNIFSFLFTKDAYDYALQAKKAFLTAKGQALVPYIDRALNELRSDNKQKTETIYGKVDDCLSDFLANSPNAHEVYPLVQELQKKVGTVLSHCKIEIPRKKEIEDISDLKHGIKAEMQEVSSILKNAKI
ncbi:hypothetical protein [Kiloniella sp.]|uniref:hypothetical protein n=1 Tax=Kiloniella sp. TaxID=1938587 RepID=UPI003A8EEBCD